MLPPPHLTAITSQFKSPLHYTIILLPWHHDTTKDDSVINLLLSLNTHTHTRSTRQLTGLSLQRSGLLLQGVYYSFSSDMLCALLSLNNAWSLFWNPLVHLAPTLSLFGFAFRCRGAPHIIEVCQTSNPCFPSFPPSHLNNDTHNLQNFLVLSLQLTLCRRPHFSQPPPTLACITLISYSRFYLGVSKPVTGIFPSLVYCNGVGAIM